MSPIRLPSLLPAHLVLAVPEMRVADPQFNLAAILALMDTRLDPDAQQIFLFPAEPAGAGGGLPKARGLGCGRAAITQPLGAA